MAACERNWNTYGFVHSSWRNKLTSTRAEDLVFIHSNMRLLSKRIEDYLKGQVRCGMLEKIIMRPLMELILFNLQTFH
jgi:hypothetical protein